MTDQLLMDNYLLILKSTVEVYVHGTLESSNNDVKQIILDNLNATLKHQEQTYNLMTQRGWYQVNNVEPAIIDNTLSKLKNK